ncbi:MFS transporter [Deinococcus yavapaiensis]|uniref:MFS transporter n=1 Tax=Deinococcus yavapaiensis TaxID=309889 RepID=UPI000DA11E78|nr:MFS transporter [Deinococcus yavapaiensis]
MRRPRVILFLTLFVATLGLSVLFPILAPLARRLGLSETEVGLLGTAYSLMQFLTAPLWQARSERVGRKPILTLGLVGFSGSFALFGLVATLGLHGTLSGWPLFLGLLVARTIGGALSSATLPTAQAYLADLGDANNRGPAMGLVGAALGLGMVFGPSISAALSSFGLLAPVYFSVGLGLLTALFARTALQEGRRPNEVVERLTPRFSLDLLARPGVALLLVVSMLYTLASVGMEQTIGFFVQDRLAVSGRDATRTIGFMLTVFGLLAALVQGGALRSLSTKFAPRALIYAGLVVMGGGMLLIALGQDFWSITFALGVVGVGSALLAPSLSAALSLGASEREQGRIAGLNASALALGRMFGPLIGAGLYQQVSVSGPYIFSGVLLLLLLLVSGAAFKPTVNAFGTDD